MRRVALLVMTCACNQVFGLHKTVARDATFFDAPTDAPFACPAADATPAFSPYVHLVTVDHCGQYFPSYPSGRATGNCHDELGNSGIYEGAIGGALTLAVPLAGDTYIDLPQLTSDGQTMLARSIDYSTNAIKVVAFTRTASGWVAAPDPPLPAPTDLWLGTIARAPDGDRVMISAAEGPTLDEWSSAGGTWHFVVSHPASELGVAGFSSHTMSSDGLRLVFHDLLSTGRAMTYYSARPSLDAPFRAATPLANLPLHTDDLVLSDDCGRITFSGLDALFYVQQP